MATLIASGFQWYGAWGQPVQRLRVDKSSIPLGLGETRKGRETERGRKKTKQEKQ